MSAELGTTYNRDCTMNRQAILIFLTSASLLMFPSAAIAQTRAELDGIVEEISAEARKAAGDTSVNFARVGEWRIRKDTDDCSLSSPDTLLVKRRGQEFIAISFSPKTPMPLKENDRIKLRLAFVRSSEKAVHETSEREFSVIELDGVSVHGEIPMIMLDDFARYEWGAFVFGKSVVLQGIDLIDSTAAITQFKACLTKIGAL